MHTNEIGPDDWWELEVEAALADRMIDVAVVEVEQEEV